jgi:hypothetical protein
MENSPFGFLFGNTTTTTAAHAEEPPLPQPTKIDPFKIPMKIVGHIMDNCYSGDGTIHPGDHLLFIHELCELFRCAGISSSQVKKKLFSLSLKGIAEEWYRLLQDGPSMVGEDIVPLFYSNFILQVKFIKIVTGYIIFGLMMERLLPKRGGD